MSKNKIITLTTDFGHADPWVGIMKGVMLSINPNLTIVDLTHEIPPQDLKKAAFCIGGIGDAFPEGTIHVCVVDPGVGSNREPVIIQTGRYFYVGPNNGVFSKLDSKIKKTAVIKNRRLTLREVSSTFHGRDIFAPAAAHLVSTPIEEFGPSVKKLAKLDLPTPRKKTGGNITGEIIYFDRFGNGYTNITKVMVEKLKGKLTVSFGNTIIGGLSRFYHSADDGSPGAIINSFGLLEIFTPNGNAREEFGLGIGDRISINPAQIG